MIVFEFKVKAKPTQYAAIDEAIRTAQFVRNKCLRYWMDNQGIDKYDLSKYCRVLACMFSFADQLNSQARQASADRAWSAITRFYENCRKKVKGPKGFPKFKKNCRSVEYKTSGWKLSENRKAITFTDKKGIGRLKLKGTYDLNFYQLNQIKRVRLVRRADGYYVQFAVKADVRVKTKPTGRVVGLDLGIKYFLADSNGHTEESPKFYRKSERQLNRANRQKSKKYRKGAKPQSKNYHLARKRYARKHLRVSRQRKEYCKRVAYSVIQSNDLVAYEDLNVKGLVRNRHLSKSISDAGWSTFRQWLEYFGHKYGKVTVAVPPHYTSVDCPKCHHRVKKSLSQRTHVCENCGYVEDRDIAASLNILQKGLSTAGHAGNYAWGDLPSWAIGAILSSNGGSENQESPRL
ncbi:transposase, IS605 family [Coleofasciculus chthonoplastes PCC 7420]|uniref:Transposase, IS605 family n=1 Tax=Coleofasciculus chthonoplastes PCC 7420 TaxID=118168 RepID=B4VZN9_9CYAN|nr:RNA-guided endonuclease TnpB family protein [Coleofasciculus chthonoplastes]EDX72611.1 transposase, IS605 family [Coleofasciculus chthonoplastes PCC 7420]